jgi:hypothetical protein
MATTTARPPRPGSAWVWNASTKKWGKPAKPKDASRSQWDDQYGWVTPQDKSSYEQQRANRLNLSWLNRVVGSDAELKALFKDAVAGGWNEARFQAKLTSTKWYRTHGKAWADAETLKATRPKEYQEQLAKQTAAILSTARSMGITLSDADLKSMSDAAMHMAWTADQLVAKLSPRMTGDNGIVLDYGRQLRELAAQNNVGQSDQWFNSAAIAVARASAISPDAAKAAYERFETDIRGHAASNYGLWADRIKSGENVEQLADAWLQQARRTLEDDSITLKDPVVDKALRAMDDKGNPALSPLWKFQQDLRKDPRWMKTQNAQQTIAATADSVLKAWGF